MNHRIFSTSGLGVKSHHRSIGTFTVRGSAEKTFNLLEDAYQYFLELNEEATLWDLTEFPELLESKHLS